MTSVDDGHAPCVEEDQRHEDVDAALLREPEAEANSADLDLVQHVEQQDPESERNAEPDRQAEPHQP